MVKQSFGVELILSKRDFTWVVNTMWNNHSPNLVHCVKHEFPSGQFNLQVFPMHHAWSAELLQPKTDHHKIRKNSETLRFSKYFTDQVNQKCTMWSSKSIFMGYPKETQYMIQKGSLIQKPHKTIVLEMQNRHKAGDKSMFLIFNSAHLVVCLRYPDRYSHKGFLEWKDYSKQDMWRCSTLGTPQQLSLHEI